MRAFLRAFYPEGWQAIEEDTESADNPSNQRALITIREVISDKKNNGLLTTQRLKMHGKF
ncbi:hypothetical protein CsSME_00014629 [Camellia sinensis var. sinensis]